LIEDVYEPLARYRDEFREKFATLAREKFKELAKRSGVNVRANRALVAEIKKLQERAVATSSKKSCYGCLMAIGFVVAAAALIGVMAADGSDSETKGMCILGIIVGLGFGIAMIPLFKSAADLLGGLRAGIDAKKEAAWRQMEPLNQLYTWDLTVKLIEATVPRLAFDPYFTAGRLESLRQQYGWDDSFNEDKSVVFAQSGEINGNPFVFAQYLDMEWGTKTYHGEKEISWTEWEEDEEGRERPVTRTETLTASVTKPIPVYNEHKTLIYGNDAAPNLSFSRKPSGWTGNDGGFWSSFQKKRRLKELKEFSRNLDDDSNFTLMNNHEFETWFHAKDRDDEVEFRLLFTPIAQAQMLELMKDTQVGYGDDFEFLKRNKINMLPSRHLDESDIDTDPSRFHSWDYDVAYANFMETNTQYFKNVYFSLAPLLAIPLYQQTRTHEEIWKDVLAHRHASFWEHEAIANYHGGDVFRHPKCVTQNILKTNVVRREGEECTVAVTAYGYEGVDRVYHEEVYGGDGKWHDVPVHWTEYLPVQRTSNMCLNEGGEASEKFRDRAAASAASAWRRSILSFPACDV